MTLARAITERMKETGIVRDEHSIYAVVIDDHNIHCLTAPMLDAWWESLTPEHKAEIYEMSLESDIFDQAPGVLGIPEPELKPVPLAEIKEAWYQMAAPTMRRRCDMAKKRQEASDAAL